VSNSLNNNSADKQRLERAMRGVEQQIAAMAPDPDRVGHKGPCFVKKDMRVGTGHDQEAMLGSLLLETMFGAALGEAFANSAMDVPEVLQEIDWGNAIDIYDEFVQDRAGGTYTLGKKGSINGTFNSFSAPKPLSIEELFNQNMDERLKLEQAYASFSHELDKFDNKATNSPSMAA
jgi:hypothetical protein